MIDLNFYQTLLFGLLIGGVFGAALGYGLRWLLKG